MKQGKTKWLGDGKEIGKREVLLDTDIRTSQNCNYNNLLTGPRCVHLNLTLHTLDQLISKIF